MKKLKSWQQDMITYSVMLITGFLFYFVPGKWISIEDDTARYLEEGGEGVLPGYPAFLAFFRGMLPEQYFLHGVVIAQSLLAVMCTFLFVLILKKQFQLRSLECIFLYIVSMLPFTIYLPEVGITHQILTEGVSYAVFYLFFLMVMKAVWTRKYRWYFGSMAMAVLLWLIRSQMLFLQIVCLILLLWLSVKKFGKKRVGRIGVCAAALAIVFLAVMGSKIKNAFSQFDTVLMARGFYEADEEDVNLFQEPMMREIFERTYQLADENEYRYEYAAPGLYMWQDLVHDRMNLFAIQAMEEFDASHPGERTRDEASIVRELGMKVMVKHFDRYLYHTVRLMMPSFIASVFFQIGPIYLLCHFIALFLYLAAISGCIIVRRKGKNPESAELMAVILGIIIIMDVTVNLLFIGLQRYVVYGMGIFYCSGYLLLRECFFLLQKSRRSSRGGTGKEAASKAVGRWQ